MERKMTKMPTKMAVLMVLAVLAAVLGRSEADLVKEFSFGEHFDEADAAGKAIVSKDFSYGGDALVKHHFIRLTPDRQSKRGYVWSNTQINRDKLTSVLTFRIHGQGRRWFGDGLAIWFTHQNEFVNGDNHAFTDKYYGFGVLFDTFHNTEHQGGHKDVTVQWNDGTKTLEDFHADAKMGCDAAIRYHAKSAEFDPVYSASRIRINIEGNKLRIDIDPKANSMWEDCYMGQLPFPADWLRRATIGITASTGALADNHDVLQLRSFDSLTENGVSELDSEMWSHHFSKEFDKMINADTCDKSCKIGIMLKFVSNYDKEVEHWFEELRESTENTIAKLNEKQDENTARIEALRLEHLVDSKVGEKMKDAKARVEEKIASAVDQKIVAGSTGWRKPFFFFIIALAGVSAFAYQKYRKLMKSHLM